MEGKERIFKVREDFLEEYYSLVKNDLVLDINKEESVKHKFGDVSEFTSKRRDVWKEKDDNFLENDFKFVYY